MVERTFKDIAQTANKYAYEKCGTNDNFEFKKQKRRYYLDSVITAFQNIGMTCEEFEIPVGEIANYNFLKINGICMIVDYTDLEFAESRMKENGQEILVDYLKNNPKDEVLQTIKKRFLDVQFESPEHFQRFYKVHNLSLFINDNLKGLHKAGLFEKIVNFADFSESWKDSAKLKKFNDLTGVFDQYEDKVRKEYDFSTDKKSNILIQIKNGQDFPYRIVSKEGIFKVYKGGQERSYMPLKFYFKKDFTSMNDVYAYIIKQHNKSAEYTHWNKIEV